MSKSSVRVPKINSEIVVALAYLGWSTRQLVDYAAELGLPIGETFIEGALAEPWPAFCSKADPVRVENLNAALASLGLGLQDNVFGIIIAQYTRLPAAQCSEVTAVMALLANLPEAHLRLVIQAPTPASDRPTAALLVNTGDRYLLCDSPALEPGELINQLYASCLARLSVADYNVKSTVQLSVEDAVSLLVNRVDYRWAQSISRERVAQLLTGGATL